MNLECYDMTGTTSLTHLHENLEARNIKLSVAEIAEMTIVLNSSKIAGDRSALMAHTYHGNA